MKARAYISQIGLEGMLMVLGPMLLLTPFLGGQAGVPALWRLLCSGLAATCCLVCAVTLLRRPRWGKVLAIGAILFGYGATPWDNWQNPFAALAGLIGMIFILFTVLEFSIATTTQVSDHAERCLQRARWATLTVPVLALVISMGDVSSPVLAEFVLAASSIIAQALMLHWLITRRAVARYALPATGIACVTAALLFLSSGYLVVIVAAVSVLCLMAMPRSRSAFEREEHWWGILLNHPARVLFTTFLCLAALGTLLLLLPLSTSEGSIALVDAVFTAVSAVCVTGLIVLDTPNDFSVFGQMFIVLLIQLGGLGIMSITTVALQAMGRRLSLKQERLLTSMTDTSHRDLLASLATILKFTFVAEAVGAILLTLLFRQVGEPWLPALWRGTFTAISAFCNAGFALQSDSLIPYQSNPLILHTVALLIILGGIAPATSLLFPKWLAGKRVPIPAKISFATTAVLLFAGTFCLLAFEWKGILAGLPVADKLQNAWFQSVTLRTAGFNSVDLAHISGSTFLLMNAFMFIGGSPGGTAGGVKTTTFGILAVTFWTCIANRSEVVIQQRRIHPGTIYRAVTVVAAGGALWFLVVLMLEVTQQIPTRDLLFEATSAIGTVGLSTGATPLLDEIGKVIVILAMFAGRIGPVTLFMLLSEEQPVSDSRYPMETVSIT